MLHQFLAALADLAVSSYLYTTGDVGEVEAELHRIHVTGHFMNSSSQVRILKAQSDAASFGHQIREFIAPRTLANMSLLVDGRGHVCDNVETANPGMATFACELTRDDCQNIVEHIKKLTLGIRAEACTADSTLSSVKTNSAQSLQAFFDFDNTITQRMVFNDLLDEFGGHKPTREMAQAKDDAWWFQEFGGPERVAVLASMLGRLRDLNVKCYVCSLNEPDVIMEGLHRVHLTRYFCNDSGWVRIVPRGLPDKGLRVRQVLNTYGADAAGTMFVDDSSANCRDVSAVAPGIGVLHCSCRGLSMQDCEHIVAHFQSLASAAESSL